MSVPMEWTGWQQVQFYLESLPWGMLVGLLFDINSGIIRTKVRMTGAVLLDSVFGVLAAGITFFGALVIMDGQLHPLLFCGILSGFLLEHYTVGKAVAFCLARGVRALRQIRLWCYGGIRWLFQKIVVFFSQVRSKTQKPPSKGEKNS